MHTTHWLSCAIRMRAASRTRTGNVLLLYAASLSRFTALPISGRSDHTMTASPPSPAGTSMRAMAEPKPSGSRRSGSASVGPTACGGRTSDARAYVRCSYGQVEMELGVVLPQTEIGPDPADIVRFVEAAEASGVQARGRVRPRRRRGPCDPARLAGSVRPALVVPRAVRAVRVPRRAHAYGARHRRDHPSATASSAGGQAGRGSRRADGRQVPPRRRHRLEPRRVRGARSRLPQPSGARTRNRST